MAASSEYDIDFEELERLFIDDTTDEQFSFDENEAISEPSLSGKDSFLSTNVSVSSLKLVLDRLADRQTNFVEQERAIASVLSKVDEVKFVEFVASVAGLSEQCFGLRCSKQNKHLRGIELERNFTECCSKTNPASKAWQDILLVLVLQAFLDTGLPRGNRHERDSQVPCKMPSLPNPTTREGWPHHRGLRPLLFSNSSEGSFTSHKNRSVKAL